MSVKALTDLHNQFCEELDALSRKGSMSSADLQKIDTYTQIASRLEKMICFHDMENGNSGRGGTWEANGSYAGGMNSGRSYRGGNSMDGGNSGNIGGLGNRFGNGDPYENDRSYRRGYSRADGKQEMKRQLEQMMNEAPDDRTREAIRKAMREFDD